MMQKHGMVRVQIHFLTPEEGGRSGLAAFSGYRPHFHFEPDSKSGYSGYDGIITLEGRDECLPGETCLARVQFLHPEFLENWLQPGTHFEVREGTRVVGVGSVLEAQ